MNRFQVSDVILVSVSNCPPETDTRNHAKDLNPNNSFGGITMAKEIARP
jgi:hypothetical protein